MSVYIGSVELTNHSRIASNRAVMGGAVALHDSTMAAEDADFEANKANYGGAVFARPRGVADSYRRSSVL